MKKIGLKKFTAAKACAIFCGVNFAVFILYYLANYILTDNASLYISSFAVELLLTVLPVTAAALSSAVWERTDAASAFKLLIATTLPSLLFRIPLEYMNYMDSGYLSEEAVLIAVLISLLYVAFFYAEASVYLLIIKGLSARSPSASKVGLLDLSSPLNLSLFICASARFIFNLIFELIDTVSFLTSYSAVYTAGEIIYICARYIWILAMLAASYMSAHASRAVMLKGGIESADEAA